MFGLSFSELIIVIIIGIFVLGPKEFAKIVNTCKKFIQKINSEWMKIVDESEGVINSSKKAEEEVVKYTIDLEGNMQKVYDLEQLKPYIKKDKKGEE